MRTNALALIAMTIAGCVVTESDGDGGDADADADTDADTDADSDADTDTDGGECADIDGPYDLSGTCEVARCVVTQNGCEADYVCDGGAMSLHGTVGVDDFEFVDGAGLVCAGTIEGGSLVGTCEAEGFEYCAFEATPK